MEPDPRDHSHPNKVPYELVDTPWVRDIMDMGGPPVARVGSSPRRIWTTPLPVFCTALLCPTRMIKTMTTLKEIVLHRYPRVKSIFNIVEHGDVSTAP